MQLIPPLQTAPWLAAQQAAGSLRRFLAVGTTWHPHRPSAATRLVTDGPNAVTRNPMYLAMTLGLAGTGLLSGRSWTAVAAAGLATTLTPQIEREEAALAELFGAQWRAYTTRVPRWLGLPSRGQGSHRRAVIARPRRRTCRRRSAG